MYSECENEAKILSEKVKMGIKQATGEDEEDIEQIVEYQKGVTKTGQQCDMQIRFVAIWSQKHDNLPSVA